MSTPKKRRQDRRTPELTWANWCDSRVFREYSNFQSSLPGLNEAFVLGKPRIGFGRVRRTILGYCQASPAGLKNAHYDTNSFATHFVLMCLTTCKLEAAASLHSSDHNVAVICLLLFGCVILGT